MVKNKQKIDITCSILHKFGLKNLTSFCKTRGDGRNRHTEQIMQQNTSQLFTGCGEGGSLAVGPTGIFPPIQALVGLESVGGKSVKMGGRLAHCLSKIGMIWGWH